MEPDKPSAGWSGTIKGLAAILVVLATWLAGLAAFADRVARLTPARSPAEADGIVALTGGSDLRLQAAADLLEAGKAGRLLISGVNRRVGRSDLQALTRAPKPLFDCCVDLGFTAEDTVGNARETVEWARGMHYSSLILVTADYHMPRALLELHASAPNIAIESYPVATSELDARRWAATTTGARRMMAEYSKYLAILTRETLVGIRAPRRVTAS